MESDQWIGIGIGAVVCTTMVIVGLDVTWHEFKRLFRHPKPVLTGLLSFVLLVPAAMVATHLADLPAHLEAGILLFAICPAGNISNLYTVIGRGNTALTIMLCVVSILLSFATIPLGIAIYGYFLDNSYDLQVPISMLLSRLGFGIALPVGIGMWIRSRFPKVQDGFRKLLRRFLLLSTLALGGFIIFSDTKGFSDDFRYTALAAALLTAFSMAIGYGLSRITRQDLQNRIALTMVSPIRNMGVVIALAVNVFHQSEFATFAVTMFMVQIPLMLTAALFFRKKSNSLPST